MTALSYKDNYPAKMIEFFNVPRTEEKEIWIKSRSGLVKRKVTIASDFPTFQRFAFNIGVHSKTLLKWRKKYPKFDNAYQICQDLQQDFLIVNSLRGAFDPGYSMFISRAIGIRDDEPIEHDDKNTIEITYTTEEKKEPVIEN